MIYYIDIDGTICHTDDMKYEDARPVMSRINYINKLYDQGHTIVYWTARGSGSGIDHYNLTESQLNEWGAKYHYLRCDKPVFDKMVDDKSQLPESFFGGKTVAVVCSAAYMQGSGYGKEIDSADIVVRINYNALLCDRYPGDIGRKTDVVYMCGSLYRENKHKKHNWPQGADIIRVNTGIPGARDGSYTANTGVRAMIDYALKGYRVKGYGMDFYSSINNGIIPDKAHVKWKYPIKVREAEVYLEGYKRNGGHVFIGHVGGVRDIKLLLNYAKQYPIAVDEHMKKIIERNTFIQKSTETIKTDINV
jgi:hypothetical protein